MIDAIAERYKLLPSEVISRADTFDLAVLITSIAYKNELNANAGNKNFVPKYKQPDQSTLVEMLNKVRQHDGKTPNR